VLAPEFCDGVLCSHKLLAVTLELLLDELPRRVRILAFVAEASFHKNGQQRLHHSLGPLAIMVGVADGVQVFPSGAADRQFPDEPGDELLVLVLGSLARVHAGHLDHLFDVHAADQGSAHH
jgi:hypothetical protein